MKKKTILHLILTLLAVLLLSTVASADWKTTKRGVIYTASGKPGYLTGFQKIDGYRYYFEPSGGVMATGWRSIQSGKNTYRYYFGTDGKARTGLVKIDNANYYFNKKGRMQFGFLTVGGKGYYANPSTGILACSQWIDDASGSYYFLSDCSMAVNRLVQGNWLGADGKSAGVKQYAGFVRENRKIYYYNSAGKRVTGWLLLAGKSYYLAPELRTGWFSVGSATYYADANGVVQKNTWVGKKYLTSTGAMAVGWLTIGSARYYFKASGNRVSGGKTISGKRYRFTSAGVQLINAWYTTKKGEKYYYGSDGVRCSGLTRIDGKYYLFGTDGKMLKKMIKSGSLYYYAHKKTGVLFQNKWFTKEGYKYYAMGDCHLATGLVVINNKTYIFSKKGKMYAGRKRTVDGKTYYLGADGAALVSRWKKINGKYYYFGSNGVMAKNTVVDNYQVDANGVRGEKVTGGWVTKNGKKYYVTGGTYATGLTTISGSTYYFNSDGVMQTGIQTVSGKKRYFYPGGAMAKSITIAVSDKEYTINASGVVTAEKTINVSGNSVGSKMAKYALKYVGNPYVYGGTSLTGGADCSGFVMTVHANFGIKILRVANDQMNGPSSSYINAGYKKAVVVSSGSMQPGDLVFYGSGNYASHVGMYIGDGKIVHASNSQPYPAGGIKISPYNYQTPIKIVRYWS